MDIERSTVADWMLLRGYTVERAETVQDLLFQIEAQAKGRGGPPEPPPGEGDWKLARAEIERLRAAQFTREELDRLRQWRNALDDVAPNFLEEGDNALALKVMRALEQYVPERP